MVHEMDLADILEDEGEALARRLDQAVNEGTAKWGVKVEALEITEVTQLQVRKFGGIQQPSGAVDAPLSRRDASDPQPCPYCHKLMEKGTVRAESVTDGARWHRSRSTFAQGGEPVGDYSTGGLVWIDGYRCKSCDKRILQV